MSQTNGCQFRHERRRRVRGRGGCVASKANDGHGFFGIGTFFSFRLVQPRAEVGQHNFQRLGNLDALFGTFFILKGSKKIFSLPRANRKNGLKEG
jgi:hypothetical protein